MVSLRKNVAFLIVIVIFYCSCQSNTQLNTDYATIRIDNSNISDSFNLSSKIQSIKIFQLKEPKGNYMGRIFNIICTKNKIIAFDRISTNKINLFDGEGNFIKTIIKKGEGPGTALNLVDCWLNDQHRLEAYDFAQMKVYLFDSSFKLQKTIKGKNLYHFWNIASIPLTNKYIGYSSFSLYNKPFRKRYYHLAILDKSLNIVGTFLHYKKLLQGVNLLSFRENFYRFNDSLRFYKPFSNLIYDIANGRVSVRYKLKYKSRPLPDDINPILKRHLKDFKKRPFNPAILNKYFHRYSRFDGHWLENKKYVYFISKNSGKKQSNNRFITLFDKTNGKAINTKLMFDNHFYKMEIPPFRFYSSQTNEYVSITNGERLNTMLYKGSPFKKKVVADPEIFYIVKVKSK